MSEHAAPEPTTQGTPLPEPLRCPSSGRPLVWAERDGEPVVETDDGSTRYPVEDGIPVLIAERALRPNA
ncbi:MAG: Trm112 family protein [Planctomycetota bacterium]